MPTFNMQVNGEKIVTMFDTGSQISVWVGSERVFKSIFYDARLNTKRIRLSGFGGSGESAAAYTIPEVRLSDGKSEYTIKNFVVILSPKKRL